MASRPIKAARAKAREVSEATGTDRWIWRDWDGNFYVTAASAHPPIGTAWVFERVIYRGEPKKPEPRRVPGMGVSAYRVPKPRTRSDQTGE